jgi:hypothetical protein
MCRASLPKILGPSQAQAIHNDDNDTHRNPVRVLPHNIAQFVEAHPTTLLGRPRGLYRTESFLDPETLAATAAATEAQLYRFCMAEREWRGRFSNYKPVSREENEKLFVGLGEVGGFLGTL